MSVTVRMHNRRLRSSLMNQVGLAPRRVSRSLRAETLVEWGSPSGEQKTPGLLGSMAELLSYGNSQERGKEMPEMHWSDNIPSGL